LLPVSSRSKMRAYLISSPHAELNVRLPTGRDIRIVPSNADRKCKKHRKKIVDVDRPFVGEQITVLVTVSLSPVTLI
jgi:hypothetical protein